MRFQEDHHYIKLIRQGDKQAFSLLVQKHQNLVYTLALRILRNPEEAQEAAQDAFIKVYQSLSSFESKSKFTTWLYRIVYNESLGRLRKTKREFVLVDELMANPLLLGAGGADLPQNLAVQKRELIPHVFGEERPPQIRNRGANQAEARLRERTG